MGNGKFLQSLTFQDRRLESGRTKYSKAPQRIHYYSSPETRSSRMRNGKAGLRLPDVGSEQSYPGNEGDLGGRIEVARGKDYCPGRNYRTHSAPGRGETAILIKNCFPHYHVPTSPQFTGVEATLIMLTPTDHEPILIGSTYIPPINEYFRNLGALETIFNFNNMTILVGDFNAKHSSWGCPVSDSRGNRLYRYVVSNGIDVLEPPTPTRFGTASATIIDYALMKTLNWPCTIDSIAELSSDHNPIKLNFLSTSKFEIPLPQLSTTWSVFTNTLANNENLYLPQASSTPEIESQVRDLTAHE
ncbi:putative RNA-directed DNA polymerase from transposon BS [Trichonephila clavipes]|nr:putative RNA-directed DNA polymerase from transposon BS [Trichonephila clavipes]